MDKPTTEQLAALAWLGVIPPEQRQAMPAKLSELRAKLNDKAKQDPKFRFYTLYDRIYRADVLRMAWQLVRRNNGAPGVDRISFKQIESTEGGVDQYLATLAEELRTKSYHAQPVRRHYIEKSDGRMRPLGIPVITDRVVQMAVLLIIEPIFEADFLDCSHGFRRGRSAHDALGSIQQSLREGYRQVYDADIEAYFDTIPHEKLMAALQRRISDRSVLGLIRQWLKAPVIEPDDPTPRRTDRGTPQGGVLSPLLANIYLHWFDRAFHGSDGPARRLSARLVRYADDFVVLARRDVEHAGRWVEDLLHERFGLRINARKTRVVDLNQNGSFDFLGHTFRMARSPYDASKRYLRVEPSKQALKAARRKIHGLTSRSASMLPLPVMLGRVTTYLRGWRGYYCFGHPKKAYSALNWYVLERTSHNLYRRSQRRYRQPEGVSLYDHIRTHGYEPL